MSLPELADDHWSNWELEGWAFEEGYPNTIGFAEHFSLYNKMIDWIKANVVNYRQNSMWTKIGDCIYIKLRKEQDAMLFILTFGAPQA